MRITSSLRLEFVVLVGLAAAVAAASDLDIRGINFVSHPFTRASYADSRSKDSLKHLKSTGANWVSIPVVWFQDDVDSSEIKPVIEEVSTGSSVHRSPSQKEIRAVLGEAKDQELDVMLMPMVHVNKKGWVRSSRIGERMSPYQVRLWFENYKEFLVKMAKLASAFKVKILCIGYDLRYMGHYESFWNEIIDSVRAEYKGKLTYAASSRDEYRQTGFWAKLDYVGLLADPKLKLEKTEGSEEIEKKLDQFLEIIFYLKKIWKKEVLITRAARSGFLVEHKDGKAKKVLHETQESFFRGLHNKVGSEVLGIFFGDWSAHPAHGGDQDGSISPQFKKGEKAIREIFKAEDINVPDQPKEESPKMYGKYSVELDV